jgi:hypothetical protein
MGRLVKNLDLNGSTNSLLIPQGTTATQPTSPIAGMIRYNTTLNMLEFYNGSAFVQLAGGTGGKSTITRDAFTLDGSTTVYPGLSFTPTSDENVLVFIEGVFQKDDTYSIAGTTITLSSTLPSDAGKTLSVIHGFDSL